MNGIEALSRAKQIAGLIVRGANVIGNRSIRDQTLMAGLSVHMAAQKKDIPSFDPKVKEIVLFGSAAEAQMDGGEERVLGVGDIDLMMFDGGFYSNVLSIEPAEERTDVVGKRLYTWSEELRENIETLFCDYFDLGNDPQVQEILADTLVDLHVLPISFFTDEGKRRSIEALHYDPNFFHNAFSNAMRYDTVTREFMPVTLDYFTKKYEIWRDGKLQIHTPTKHERRRSQ